jgi:uncharacterized protein with PIN domain
MMQLDRHSRLRTYDRKSNRVRVPISAQDMKGTIMKEGDECKHCKKGVVEKVDADEPWHTDYLICTECDSTYNEE